MMRKHFEQILPVLSDQSGLEQQDSQAADRMSSQAAARRGRPEKGIGYHIQKLMNGFEPCLRELQVIKSAADKLKQQRNAICTAEEEVDIGREIQHVVTLLDYELEAAQIEVICDFDDRLGPVEFSPAELSQVFMNLLLNGVEAIKEKKMTKQLEGTSAAEDYKPQIRITGRNKDGKAWIVFRDNGIGIRKDDLGKIFDPFFTTKPPDRGTGLGLSIVSKILKQHNARLTVNSKEGEYSEFVLELPLRKRASDERQSA